MSVTGKHFGLLAAIGSATLLLSAFAFQSFGYAPCAMCIWQRYPHGIAVAIGVLLLTGVPTLLLLTAGAAAALTTAGIGFFHTGVERGWWEGPTSCTGSGLDISNLSGADLLPSASSAPSALVMCDEVAWEFLSLSMASWNAVLSLMLAVVWAYAAYKHSFAQPKIAQQEPL
ncbi:disulfide bond formation protein B [Roseovarius phycicola]|uniref:Disulfide bond formation protein B n=1 Tax=Roseovarius phycicola TaxID=3080976 RepID=A0ABZ2HKG8_9RHOB